MLYCEGMYQAAEVKYILTIAMLFMKDMSESKASTGQDCKENRLRTLLLSPPSLGKYFLRLKIAALSNIATCRLKRSCLVTKKIQRKAVTSTLINDDFRF